MKKFIGFVLILFYSVIGNSQSEILNIQDSTIYEVSQEFPYGKIHPQAPEAISDFDMLIGSSICKSSVLLQGGKWSGTFDIKWNWKYIMNGRAVQDEGWYHNQGKETYFTSVRAYNPSQEHWYVSFFTPTMQTTPRTWTGGRKKDANNKDVIELIEKKTNANGDMIWNVLTFYDISDSAFHWKGEIANKTKKTEQTFWKIDCVKSEKGK
ncbi:MAG: hypothetical protein V3V00_14600 [Saprospiraceae bacterium]